jgi:uncharacterized membrane protein
LLCYPDRVDHLADDAITYALVGALAGGRTTAAPVVAHERLRARAVPPRSTLARALASDRLGMMLRLGAIVEVVVDKLPVAGDRTNAIGLTMRTISGAVSGAALSSADNRGPVLGAVLGTVGAVAGSFALFHLRRALHERLRMPGLVAGLAEDVLLLGLGRLALR